MIKRVIEEFSIESETINREYNLNITPKKIMQVLDDLSLSEDDHEDEIYGPYSLSEVQIRKLKPFSTDPLHENLDKFTYELGCYEDQKITVPDLRKEKTRSVKEFGRSSKEINKSYELLLDREKILKILADLIVDEDDDDLDDVYMLTNSQIEKLKPFLKENLSQDLSKYNYYLYYWQS
jgi:hypothetical protein